ncbi:cyd operon YbgE family protein [Flavobacterium sp. W21_SRS_FM6]|uniref:cyd operon YbgE family protein n=1 Tax=Flavobacterium sp. W21_SRS_FM6 TaxID=3240268 RepID=UPI003F8E18A0
MSKHLKLNMEEPRENPLGFLNILVFCLSLAVMIIITAWPHVFGTSADSMAHDAAMLSMVGMSCGFIYGIGFTPKMRVFKLLFSAPVALILMLAGFFLALV